MIKKVGMIGRGAVGTLFGSLIQKEIGNEDFCFIIGENRIHDYETKPFYINDELCTFRYVTPKLAEKLDLLFISTKFPVLKDTIEIVKPFIKDDTIIVSLLNGISSEEVVEKTLQKGIVIHSIAQMMDALKDSKGVTYTKTGEIVIGVNTTSKENTLREVNAFLDKVHIPHHIAKDIVHEQWSKLMLNCGLNQICAVYDVPYEGCQEQGKYRTLFIEVMKEVAMVAKLEGIIISEKEIEDWLVAVDHLSKDSMPSMRQDTLAKRYTEVDLFSKTMMDLAQKYQVEVPLNTELYHKIKEIENKY